MLLLRALGRLVGMLWMVVIALFGLGVAMYCFDGLVSLGSARPDRLLHLPSVRRHVGHFLAQMAAPGSTAGLALLCGLGAVALGLLVALGILGPRRQRLAVMETGPGRLAARPSALRAIARTLAEDAAGTTGIRRLKVKPSRVPHRGRVAVTATLPRDGDRSAVKQAVRERLDPITEPFGLTPRIEVRVGDGGERVQ